MLLPPLPLLPLTVLPLRDDAIAASALTATVTVTVVPSVMTVLLLPLRADPQPTRGTIGPCGHLPGCTDQNNEQSTDTQQVAALYLAVLTRGY